MIRRRFYVIAVVLAFAAFGTGVAVEAKHRRWNLDAFNPIGTSLLDLKIHSKIAQIVGREPEKINKILSLRINADLALIDGVVSGKIGKIPNDKKVELCDLVARLSERHEGQSYWKSVSDGFAMLRIDCPQVAISNPDLTDGR